MSGFDSRRYRIFWEVMGPERGPLSLVSTIEELLGRKNSGSGLERREYDHGGPLHWPCDTPYSQKLILTSPTSGGRSVGIVRSRSEDTELFLLLLLLNKLPLTYSFTTLQAGRWRVRFQTMWLDFQFPYSFQAHYGPPLAETNTRNLPGR
jgi:hypothetical protein